MTTLLALIAVVALSGSAVATDAEQFAKLQEVGQLCDQYFLPNSMALLPGVDPQEHSMEIERQLRDAAQQFDNGADIYFLRRQVQEKDPCAKQLLKFLSEKHRASPTPTLGAASRF